jgi:hypothetical protein
MVYRGADDEEGGEALIDSRFTVWDTTSDLPDDSREADERAAERRVRDLRGRVKAARAALAATPGAAEAMGEAWRKQAGFRARHEISQAQFRRGVTATKGPGTDAFAPD